MPSNPRDLAEHLRFYADLGVSGFSRDLAWRVRPNGDAGRRAASAGDDETATASVDCGARSGRCCVRPLLTSAQDSVIAPSSGSRAEALAIVRADLGECTRCKLHKGRTNVVFGVGNAEARLMFVGEGPGADEDVQGEPFVGRAGQQLTKIINAMGFEREDVYIANVVKCRPPGNRNPEPDEIEQCEPFLMRQIDVHRARSHRRARQVRRADAAPDAGADHAAARALPRIGDIEVMPTFHPSYLLRNPAAKREVWEDMKMVMAALKTDI